MHPAGWEEWDWRADDDEQADMQGRGQTYLWGVRMTLGDYRARQPGRLRGQRLPSTPSEGWQSYR